MDMNKSVNKLYTAPCGGLGNCSGSHPSTAGIGRGYPTTWMVGQNEVSLMWNVWKGHLGSYSLHTATQWALLSLHLNQCNNIQKLHFENSQQDAMIICYIHISPYLIYSPWSNSASNAASRP